MQVALDRTFTYSGMQPNTCIANMLRTIEQRAADVIMHAPGRSGKTTALAIMIIARMRGVCDDESHQVVITPGASRVRAFTNALVRIAISCGYEVTRSDDATRLSVHIPTDPGSCHTVHFFAANNMRPLGAIQAYNYYLDDVSPLHDSVRRFLFPVLRQEDFQIVSAMTPTPADHALVSAMRGADRNGPLYDVVNV